ncbi:MAG: hypothetical protein HQ581_28225 [Planctomycetes bacterium]|nr:hypothetical protein [Planctomycetota bacterium]
MPKVAAFWFVLTVLSHPLTAGAGLLGYWPLDGDAKAVVGPDGSLAGQPVATAGRGEDAGGAIALDGAKRQYVTIPGGGSLSGRDTGTVSLWVRWDSAGQDGNLPGVLVGAVLGRQKDGRDNFLERAKVETRIQQTRADGSGGIVVLGADRGRRHP